MLEVLLQRDLLAADIEAAGIPPRISVEPSSSLVSGTACIAAIAATALGSVFTFLIIRFLSSFSLVVSLGSVGSSAPGLGELWLCHFLFGLRLGRLPLGQSLRLGGGGRRLPFISRFGQCAGVCLAFGRDLFC